MTVQPPLLSRLGRDDHHGYAPAVSGPAREPAWAPARYESQKWPNPLAMAGSLLIVGGILSAFAAFNVVPIRRINHPPIVVNLLPQPSPPPPQPTPPQRAPKVPAKVTPAIVAPPAQVEMPAPAVQVATVPVAPPPEVTVAGPPSPTPPAPPPRIESVGDLSSKMIRAEPPRYPIESRRKREQGTVVLSVILAPDGSVADISVATSSGFASLDKAALVAVRRWRWSPTLRSGAPVMVRGLVEIPFILKG